MKDIVLCCRVLSVMPLLLSPLMLLLMLPAGVAKAADAAAHSLRSSQALVAHRM